VLGDKWRDKIFFVEWVKENGVSKVIKQNGCGEAISDWITLHSFYNYTTKTKI
jgi:hypothetical protein